MFQGNPVWQIYLAQIYCDFPKLGYKSLAECLILRETGSAHQQPSNARAGLHSAKIFLPDVNCA